MEFPFNPWKLGFYGIQNGDYPTFCLYTRFAMSWAAHDPGLIDAQLIDGGCPILKKTSHIYIYIWYAGCIGLNKALCILLPSRACPTTWVCKCLRVSPLGVFRGDQTVFHLWGIPKTTPPEPVFQSSGRRLAWDPGHGMRRHRGPPLPR